VLEQFDLAELVAATRDRDAGVLARLDAACSEAGAFALSGVVLPPGLMERMHRDTLDLFRLPASVKERLQDPEDQYVGWKGDANRNAHGFPDTKEMFHIGPRVDPTLRGPDAHGRLPEPSGAGDCPLWPAELPALQDSWRRYYRAMQDVGTVLGLAFAATLRVPEQAWLDLVEDNWADLAANYYPPVGAAPVGVRNAVHADLTMFTVLYQDEGGGGGLRMRTRDGRWVVVPPDQGTLLVNIGELLTYLTAGRWWPVPHEVGEADPAAPGADTPRISIPFFYRPHDRRTVVPLLAGDDVAPVQVGAWVRERKLADAAPA
jgi:isopenicillin N synthase-like dioxygenase